MSSELSQTIQKLADRVADLCTAWSDTDERDKRDAIANELREAAEALAGRDEPVAWLINPCAPLGPEPTVHKARAEEAAANGLQVTSLYTTPSRAGGGEVGDGFTEREAALLDALADVCDTVEKGEGSETYTADGHSEASRIANAAIEAWSKP